MGSLPNAGSNPQLSGPSRDQLLHDLDGPLDMMSTGSLDREPEFLCLEQVGLCSGCKHSLGVCICRSCSTPAHAAASNGECPWVSAGMSSLNTSLVGLCWGAGRCAETVSSCPLCPHVGRRRGGRTPGGTMTGQGLHTSPSEVLGHLTVLEPDQASSRDLSWLQVAPRDILFRGLNVRMVIASGIAEAIKVRPGWLAPR